MKAKVFMLSLVVALTAFVAQAQEASQVDNRPAYKTEFEQDPAAHWFIELHGGAAMLPFGNKANGEAEFVNRISPIRSDVGTLLTLLLVYVATLGMYIALTSSLVLLR